MKKVLSILIVGLVLMAISSSPVFAGEKKICKLGHVNSPASIFQFGALAFKEAVEKELPDWTIEVYPAGGLGGTLAMIQGMTLGTVDIYTEFISVLADLVPEYKVFAVHYKFDSVGEYELFMNSATFASMNEKMIKKNGITNIGNMSAGSIYNHFSNKAMYTISDAKGVINRVAQMAPLVQCWKAYGAKPTSMDWGEIYTSLQTGVITSIDNPILDMFDEKFHEAVKYVNMTNNLYNMISYNTSMAFWKTLNDKEKDVFRRAVRVASIKGQMEVERRLAGVKAELKSKNIKTIQTDVSGFKKAVQDNINTILANDKDAIAVYKKIMAKDY
ncbi:MAG: TRAP transporter substrate-binding protein [Desulfobacula sp.]|jgi:TRAP-type C4-dicarboxylate transport system substrate-binding protein|nr:TRAP transporter substrate-binding protein [Desulfobacula sp.]